MSAIPIHLRHALAQTEFVSDLANGWMRDALANGGEAEEMIAGLTQMGRPPEIASLMVGLAQQGLFITRGEAGLDPRMVSRSLIGSPDVPHGREHIVEGGDGGVRKVLSTGEGNLQIVLYDGFIRPEEMAFLKETTAHRLERSAVVGPGFSHQTHQSRTSSGAFIDVGAHPLIAQLEARIARITGVPVNHGEAFQVLHYGHTEEYQPHYDFFEPSTDDEKANLAGPGNRTSTLLFYLNDVDEGGATYFPKLDLAIHPKPGQALWFGYLGADGKLDYRSEHAGLPVIRGTKWIATKWLRERPITQPPVATWAHGGEVVDLGAAPPVSPALNKTPTLTLVR
jgi:prolyl 4-hydroxylase